MQRLNDYSKICSAAIKKNKSGNTNVGFGAMLLPNRIFWHYIQVISQIAFWKKELMHAVPVSKIKDVLFKRGKGNLMSH